MKGASVGNGCLSPTPSSDVGVIAISDIPSETVVGAYPKYIDIGYHTQDIISISCILEVQWKNGQVVMDGDHSNQWMIYIQPARDRHEQNVEAFMDEKEDVYLRFIRGVKCGEQLLVWFHDTLARYRDIPILKPENIRGYQEYTCTVCQKVFKFPNSLKAHIRYWCRKEEGVISSSTEDKEKSMWLRNEFYPLSGFPHIPPRSDVPNFKSAAPVFHKLQDIQSDPMSRTQQHSDQALNLSKRGMVHTTTTNHPANLHQPIQIFNHIHTPAFPITMSSSPFPLYHPVLSQYSRPCCSQLPSVHPFMDRPFLSSCASRYTPPSSSSPVSSTASSHLPAHHHQQLPSSYTFPLPSEKQGEPLDLLPKSLYTSTSRRGHLCIYCGKLYSRKYGLKIHLRTHTGYKPLKCKVCLRPFGDPSNLNKHVRLHAEGDTPYKCQYCGKVLVRRRDLERHVKSRHPHEDVTSSEIEADSSTLDSSLDDNDSDSTEIDSELIVV